MEKAEYQFLEKRKAGMKNEMAFTLIAMGWYNIAHTMSVKDINHGETQI